MAAIFHLAINVTDLAAARHFYGALLGCEEGRSTATWVDYDFFGHQLSLHLGTPLTTAPTGHPTLVKSTVAPTISGSSDDVIPLSIEAFLQTQLRHYFAAHQGELPAPGLYNRLLVRLEKPLIIQTLRATGGNQIKAAEILGLNRNTLRKKMRELNIDARQLLTMADAA
jgi:DNA-binding protein Fis